MTFDINFDVQHGSKTEEALIGRSIVSAWRVGSSRNKPPCGPERGREAS